MNSITLPIKIVGDEKWIIFSEIAGRGDLRAVRIDKRKKQVLDWDGHHCDEASAKGSVRFLPKGLKIY